jgi:L-fuculose-phosphate aldolase
MKLEKERELIVLYGRRLLESGLTKGTGGNISICNRTEGLVAISPSGIDYQRTRPEDVVVLDMAGNIVEGQRTPSSETGMHRIFYEKRDDVNAVVHAHSPYCSVMACLNWDLPATHYMIALAGKNVRCAEYATFGTPQLAENAFAAMKDRNAVLLANHGLLAGGANIASAFNTAEEIEFCAQIYCRAQAIGNPVILSDEEMETMAERFTTYGQPQGTAGS